MYNFCLVFYVEMACIFKLVNKIELLDLILRTHSRYYTVYYTDLKILVHGVQYLLNVLC